MRVSIYTFILVVAALWAHTSASAQELPDAPKEVVQFSGMIRDEISKAPVPFAIVYVDKEKRGTVSTLEGFFSFAVAKGDIILFKSLGYKPLRVQVPYDAAGTSYFKDIEMARETYMLDTFTVYPLPKPHQLRQAMVNLDVPENMVDLAKKTIEKSKLEELTKATRYDGTENFNQYVKNQVQSYYHYGQPAPIKLFDVFSWAEFIKSLRKNKKPALGNTNSENYPEF